MNKSNTIKELATALSRAQAEFVPAPFNASNPHLRNKYADLGSIIESTKPILERHGLSVSQMVQGEGNEIGIITILMHASGEWLESSVVMPILEQKGINNAQVAGSIISYLRRYSLAAALGVYAGEDDDASSLVKDRTQMQKPVRPVSNPPAELPEPKAKNGNTPLPPEPDWLTANTAADNPVVMTLDFARGVTGSDGKPYGELDKKTLSYKSAALAKKLKLTDLPASEHTKAQMKLDAIKVLLQQPEQQT